jgi:3-methyladenine DNA glycosylase/8-oxoguanine DNA glycosylase
VALQAAVAGLAACDPVMAELIAVHTSPRGAFRGGRRRGQSRFEELAEAIAYQQLAGKAAEAIWRRVRGVVDGSFTPEAVLAAGPSAFRAAGFSNAKTASLLDLADRVHRGEVRLARIGRFDDEDVVAELVRVRGIGRWTAEMFLIFSLGRLDVWPVGDYGVRVGYAKAYGLDEVPAPKELQDLGEPFRPYRTLAAWYCWQVVLSTGRL